MLSQIVLPEMILQTICKDAASFYNKNWLLGTSGNLSYRQREGLEQNLPAFWVTASGLDKGQLSPTDFLLAGPEAKPVLSDETRSPSAECLLHEAIYTNFPEANVIYHTHDPLATWLSMQLPKAITTLGLPSVEMLKGLGFDSHQSKANLHVFPNSQDMSALVEAINPYWQSLEVPGFLLQGHGLYTWGKTPAQAKRHTEIFAFLFQYLLLNVQTHPKGSP